MKFLLKWAVNGAIVVFFLMYYADISLWSAALVATVLTIIAYFVGDQLILRTSNNVIATIADVVLAYVLLWTAAYSLRWNLGSDEILVIAVVLGFAEWVLHRYVFRIPTKFQAS